MPPAPAAVGTLAGLGGVRDGAWKVLSYFAGRPAATPAALPVTKPESRSDG